MLNEAKRSKTTKKNDLLWAVLLSKMAGDERIELPTVVLETIIIPFN